MPSQGARRTTRGLGFLLNFILDETLKFYHRNTFLFPDSQQSQIFSISSNFMVEVSVQLYIFLFYIMNFFYYFFLKVILLFLLLNKQTKTTTHDVILKNWVKFRVAFNVTKNWSNCVGTSPFLVPKPQTFLVTYVTAQQFSVPSVQPTADAFTEVPIDTCQPHLTDTDSIHTDTSSWIYLSKIADHFMTLALYKI